MENQLFATLDTTTRSLALPSGAPCLLTDTVGFISKLPHALVKAFRSTLEEALYADLLIIVADASNPNAANQQAVVHEVLAQLGAADKPRLVALNKYDNISFDASFATRDAIPISAKTGYGLEELKRQMEEKLYADRVQATLTIPYAAGNILAFIHKYANVSNEAYEDQGMAVTFTCDAATLSRINAMLKKLDV